MFNKLRLFLKGKSTQVEKKIVKNEAYWDGKLKDCSDKMNICNKICYILRKRYDYMCKSGRYK